MQLLRWKCSVQLGGYNDGFTSQTANRELKPYQCIYQWREVCVDAYIYYRYHLYAKHAKVSQVKQLDTDLIFPFFCLHAETVCVPARGRFWETPELQLRQISKLKQLLKASDLESRQHNKTVLFRPPFDHQKTAQQGLKLISPPKRNCLRVIRGTLLFVHKSAGIGVFSSDSWLCQSTANQQPTAVRRP